MIGKLPPPMDEGGVLAYPALQSPTVTVLLSVTLLFYHGVRRVSSTVALANAIPAAISPLRLLVLAIAGGDSSSPPPPRPLCLHCQSRPQRGPRSGSRGLCRRCYYTPGIREQYRQIHLYEEPGNGFPPPNSPTAATPGSEAKIQEMRTRFEAGKAIFHPDDEQDKGGK